MTSRITGQSSVCWSLWLHWQQRNIKCPRYCLFVRGIHGWPVNFPNKGTVTREKLPFDDVIMVYCLMTCLPQPHINIVRHHSTTVSSSFMMTSSNVNIFRVTGPLCGEFTGHLWIPPPPPPPPPTHTQRPVTRSFDVFFDLCLDKGLSKQSWGWWFETPSFSSWRRCNVNVQWSADW